MDKENAAAGDRRDQQKRFARLYKSFSIPNKVLNYDELTRLLTTHSIDASDDSEDDVESAFDIFEVMKKVDMIAIADCLSGATSNFLLTIFDVTR